MTDELRCLERCHKDLFEISDALRITGHLILSDRLQVIASYIRESTNEIARTTTAHRLNRERESLKKDTP